MMKINMKLKEINLVCKTNSTQGALQVFLSLHASTCCELTGFVSMKPGATPLFL